MTKGFRVLVAAMAALLPACGGGGHGSGTPALPLTLMEPSAGQTFTAPATISLSAVAADPGSIATVEFREEHTPQGTVVVATSTQPPFQATLTNVPAGIHTLVAVATDKLGAEMTSNSVTINVLAPDESPGGWVPIANVSGAFGGPEGMWFVDADRGWIAGHHRTILHTGDGGAGWVAQVGGVQGGTSVPGLNKIQFMDADRGWAVGSSGTVLRTTDGGATWTAGSAGTDDTLFDLSFVDADTGWVVGPGESVFATNDGGVTWTPLPTRVPGALSHHAVRFADRSNGWVLTTVLVTFSEGGTDERDVILRTTDGGLMWTEQLRSEVHNDRFEALDLVSATTAWVSRTRGMQRGNEGILHTADGGATWTRQNYPGAGIFALHFVSALQGWGVGNFGTIIHTEDGGQSWTRQRSGPIDEPFLLDVQFIDANLGWALRADGILLKTTTGGKGP